MNNMNTIETKRFYYAGKTYSSIVADTCSLIHWNFEETIKGIIPSLQMGGIKISVLHSVKKEINRFANAKENSSRRSRAIRARQNLDALSKCGLIHYVGNPNEEVGDKAILDYVLKARAKNEKILVLTQDHTLATDIMMVNKLGSCIAPWANVLRIHTDSPTLVKFDFATVAKTPSKVEKKNDPQLKAVLARFGL